MSATDEKKSTKRKADDAAAAPAVAGTDNTENSADTNDISSQHNSAVSKKPKKDGDEVNDEKEAADKKFEEEIAAKWAAKAMNKLDGDAIVALLDTKPKGVKLGKPATLAQIAKVEKTLGCELPQALKTIYLKYNGVAGKMDGEITIDGEDAEFSSVFLFPLTKAIAPLDDEKYSILDFNKWIRNEVDEEPGLTKIQFWKNYLVIGSDNGMNFEEHDIPMWAVGLHDGIVYKITGYLWDVSNPKDAYEPMTDLTHHFKRIFDGMASRASKEAPPAAAATAVPTATPATDTI